MAAKRVVMVVDMQNGVFATPRIERERCAAQINRLINAADTVIFIQHCEEGGLEEGAKVLLCCLNCTSRQPRCS